MEQTENRTRSALYEEIYKIVKQIPMKQVETDAMDAPSASYLLEQLFKKWQQHGVGGPASASVSEGEQLPAEGHAQNGRVDFCQCGIPKMPGYKTCERCFMIG